MRAGVTTSFMTFSRSGEYRLPGPVYRATGNAVLRMAPFVPGGVRRSFLERRDFYQVAAADAHGNYQGVSENKWHAMQLPDDLSGRSVLDIGCSEGFFALQCARRGATPVVGVDSSLGRLLTATFLAAQDGFDIRYRMALFPDLGLDATFDFVICLSVLHHSFARKDLWKILTDDAYADDRGVLESQLATLRALTSPGGRCIVEMPYEYEEPALERQQVDFGLFSQLLLRTGFASVAPPRSWDYNPDHRQFKDRMIYVADG
jgi:SAM-dependent methyltransferase